MRLHREKDGKEEKRKKHKKEKKDHKKHKKHKKEKKDRESTARESREQLAVQQFLDEQQKQKPIGRLPAAAAQPAPERNAEAVVEKKRVMGMMLPSEYEAQRKQVAPVSTAVSVLCVQRV